MNEAAAAQRLLILAPTGRDAALASRTAIATSIGTVLFLFLGVASCMRIMLAFSNSFENQLTAFLGFIAGGSLGLYVALNWRVNSSALTIVAGAAPLATFVAITSYLIGNFGAVFLLTYHALLRRGDKVPRLASSATALR